MAFPLFPAVLLPEKLAWGGSPKNWALAVQAHEQPPWMAQHLGGPSVRSVSAARAVMGQVGTLWSASLLRARVVLYSFLSPSIMSLNSRCLHDGGWWSSRCCHLSERLCTQTRLSPLSLLLWAVSSDRFSVRPSKPAQLLQVRWRLQSWEALGRTGVWVSLSALGPFLWNPWKHHYPSQLSARKNLRSTQPPPLQQPCTVLPLSILLFSENLLCFLLLWDARFSKWHMAMAVGFLMPRSAEWVGCVLHSDVGGKGGVFIKQAPWATNR